MAKNWVLFDDDINGFNDDDDDDTRGGDGGEAYRLLICTGVGMWLSGWSVGPSHRCRRFDSPVRHRNFLPESAFSADCLTVPLHPPCAIECSNICAHV